MLDIRDTRSVFSVKITLEHRGEKCHHQWVFFFSDNVYVTNCLSSLGAPFPDGYVCACLFTSSLQTVVKAHSFHFSLLGIQQASFCLPPANAFHKIGKKLLMNFMLTHRWHFVAPSLLFTVIFLNFNTSPVRFISPVISNSPNRALRSSWQIFPRLSGGAVKNAFKFHVHIN